jgi:hypothetical protein
MVSHWRLPGWSRKVEFRTYSGDLTTPTRIRTPNYRLNEVFSMMLAGGQLLLRGLTAQNFGFLETCDNCTTIGGGAAENAGGEFRIENSVLTGNL